ncbi:hypothetical protein D3C87_1376470 [compost metagenome]
MLHQVGTGTCVFSAGGKALGATDQGQKNRRHDPDCRISGQQTDQGRCTGHQQNRHRKGSLAADPVPQHAEENPAKGPKREGHGEYCKGLEQRGTGIAAGEKLLGDGRGQKAVDGEVEPLDEIADAGGHNHFSQRCWADLFCRCACHA